jgi:hypothetical protein
VEEKLMNVYDMRVAKGMKVLDKVQPGWHNNIDLQNLKLSWCGSCVLGQLYGRYLEGLSYVSREAGDEDIRYAPYEYGFTIPFSKSEPSRESLAWRNLEEAWRKQLIARLEAEQLVESVLAEA